MPQVHRGYTGKYFKFTKQGGIPANGGRQRAWSVPTKVEGLSGTGSTYTPGKWRSVKGPLRPCNWGLHAAITGSLKKWMSEEAYEMEYADGTDLVPHSGNYGGVPDKVCGRKARLIRKCEGWNMGMLALDAANAAISRYTNFAPRDERIATAIAAGHAYWNGVATIDHLTAAMGDAYTAAREATIVGTNGSAHATTVATAVGDALHCLAYPVNNGYAWGKRAFDSLTQYLSNTQVDAMILGRLMATGPATSTTPTTTDATQAPAGSEG